MARAMSAVCVDLSAAQDDDQHVAAPDVVHAPSGAEELTHFKDTFAHRGFTSPKFPSSAFSSRRTRRLCVSPSLRPESQAENSGSGKRCTYSLL
jgi:hypothetical protein